MTTIEERVAAPEARLLLPEHPPRLGPISRRLLLRLVVALAVVQVVGAVLIFVLDSDRARAAGASLVFPGAGFLYGGMPVLFVVTVLLMVVALVLWWGASAHVAIPLVWFGSAGIAAALVHGPKLFVNADTTWTWAIAVAYALAVTFAGTATYRFERRYRTKLAKVAELNGYLASETPPLSMPIERRADAMDVELLRWCYSIAFQPDDELIGLDWGEQMHSGTQLRYQLNALCWALSLYAVNFVPNAPSQVEAALAKLIEKHTDLRVWKYWRTLNLLGNFDPDPDPIVRDNIMFSAFLGDVLNIYEAATGSTRFDRPGSLTFVWKDGRTFEYDHHSIAAAVERNFERSTLGFFPCEPGWSFTVCNIMGAQSLRGHDTLHGTNLWDGVRPRFVHALDNEYLTPDGSYAHIRSSHVGLSWDTGEVPGGHYFANGSNRFADILPAHARRAAALDRLSAQRLKGLSSMVVDGTLELELPLQLERHRVRRSALAGWNGVIGGARLLGDDQLYLAALDASARQCATGQRWPDRPLDGGVPAVGGHTILRWSTPITTAQLNVRGYAPPTGPVLTHTSWDDVIVVEAISRDRKSLSLRIEPREVAAEELTLELGQLVPASDYVLNMGDGTTVFELRADDAGTARHTIGLDGPVHLQLLPRP